MTTITGVLLSSRKQMFKVDYTTTTQHQLQYVGIICGNKQMTKSSAARNGDSRIKDSTFPIKEESDFPL